MSFVPFDEFDQDCMFPHKSSRTILDDLVSEFDGVQSIQAGIGIAVDNTDPANPFVSAIPYVLPQATNVVLGGIRLGENLIYDSESGLVNVIIPPVPVQSINGNTGDVVLGAVDVGADPVGSATTAVGAHLADADPHPQYTNVFQYANLAAFPASGAGATLYIAADTGQGYRWNGAAYVIFGGMPQIADQTVLGNRSGAAANPTALPINQANGIGGLDGNGFLPKANIEDSWQYTYPAALFSTASTTLVDTAVGINLSSAGTYEFDCVLSLGSNNSATGVKLGWNTTNVSRGLGIIIGRSGSAGVASVGKWSFDGSSVGSIGTTGSDGSSFVESAVLFRGTLTVTAAQNVLLKACATSANTIQLFEDDWIESFIRVRKLP